MDPHTLYEELRKFHESPLWNEFLRPRLQEWVDRRRLAMETADTPEKLWESRQCAQTAAEGLRLIDTAFPEHQRRLASEIVPPVRAE